MAARHITSRRGNAAARRVRNSYGDVLTGQSRVNTGAGTQPGAAPNQQTGSSNPRIGHKFQIGLTSTGNIVHLYGSGVPAAQRRIVTGPPRKGVETTPVTTPTPTAPSTGGAQAPSTTPQATTYKQKAASFAKRARANAGR